MNGDEEGVDVGVWECESNVELRRVGLVVALDLWDLWNGFVRVDE